MTTQIYPNSIYSNAVYMNDFDHQRIIDSILIKSVAGCRDWTKEELQCQNNYPDLIEKMLRNAAKNYPENVLVLPTTTILLEYSAMRKVLPDMRIIGIPSAVMLALYYTSASSGRTAIIAIKGNYIDTSVFDIESGVLDQIYVGQGNLFMDFSRIIQDLVGISDQLRIDRLFVAHDKSVDEKVISDIQRILNMPAVVRDNLDELCLMGAYVGSGIYKGVVKDLLLLEIMTHNIVCVYNGNVVECLEAGNTIPLRKKLHMNLMPDDSDIKIFIYEGNNRSNFENTLIGVVKFKNTHPRTEHKIELIFDVDACRRIVVKAVDETSGEIKQLHI